jgi:hypothetical protein
MNALYPLEVYEYTVEHASYKMTRYDHFRYSSGTSCVHNAYLVFIKINFFTEMKKNRRSRVMMRCAFQMKTFLPLEKCLKFAPNSTFQMLLSEFVSQRRISSLKVQQAIVIAHKLRCLKILKLYISALQQTCYVSSQSRRFGVSSVGELVGWRRSVRGSECVEIFLFYLSLKLAYSTRRYSAKLVSRWIKWVRGFNSEYGAIIEVR